uniref:Uncharacterized protein n=1 Tax=Panagrolaimus sp. ES5 TaxID=591445 RepID=A0AC34FC78_9BILA
MESERELHLLNQIDKLKRRINEIQELANAQGDDFRERLEELTEQKKALAAKNTALESRIFIISEERAHLKEMVEELTAEKDKKIEAKIVEMEEDMIKIIQKAEELESTNTKLTEAFNSVSMDKKHLAKENKLLDEGALKAQLETLAAPVVDPQERGNSLFEEMLVHEQLEVEEQACQKVQIEKANVDQKLKIAEEKLAETAGTLEKAM